MNLGEPKIEQNSSYLKELFNDDFQNENETSINNQLKKIKVNKFKV